MKQAAGMDPDIAADTVAEDRADTDNMVAADIAAGMPAEDGGVAADTVADCSRDLDIRMRSEDRTGNPFRAWPVLRMRVWSGGKQMPERIEWNRDRIYRLR